MTGAAKAVLTAYCHAGYDIKCLLLPSGSKPFSAGALMEARRPTHRGRELKIIWAAVVAVPHAEGHADDQRQKRKRQIDVYHPGGHSLVVTPQTQVDRIQWPLSPSYRQARAL